MISLDDTWKFFGQSHVTHTFLAVECL